jgi:flagellar basal-body rod protein FlgB
MSGILPIADVTTTAVERALDGLVLRNEVTANNIANAEVPGFKASRVSFEQALSNAIRSGRLEKAPGAEILPTGGPAGVNGNNVDLETEFTEMMKTNLMQEAMVSAFNYKVGLLRTAVRGQ